MRLQTKISAVMLSLALAAAFAVAGLVRRGIHRVLVEQVGHRGVSAALGVQPELIPGVKSRRETALLPVLQKILDNPGVVFALVLDLRGEVLAHTDVAQKGKVFSDAQSLGALAANEPTFREAKIDGQPVLQVSFPLVDAGAEAGEGFLLSGGGGRRRVGTLRVGISLEEAAATERLLLRRALGVMGGVAGLALFLTLLLLRRQILYPLSLLAEATRRVGRGEYGSSIPSGSSDELGELARQFNKMTADLSATTVSKDFLNGILGNMMDALIVTTPDGRVDVINRAALNLFGCPVEEARGAPLTQFVQGIEGFLGVSSMKNRDCWIMAKSGRLTPVLVDVSPIRGQVGGAWGVIVAAKDITERKRAEAALQKANDELEVRVVERTTSLMDLNTQLNKEVQERKEAERSLRESEERLRSVISSAPVILSAFNVVGAVTFCAGKGLSALNLDPAAATAEEADALLRQVPSFTDNVGRALAGESFTALMALGGLTFDAWFAPVDSPDGKPRGALAVMLDVTERRKLQEQLAQSQKMQAMGQLAGGVAHDFNNLLTVISGYTQILLHQTRTAEDRSCLEQVDFAAQQAAGLTQQLLAFSRKQVVQPRVMDLNGTVAQMQKMLRRLIGENVELVTRPAPGGAVIKADAGQMEQVLLNLVVNARDAMPQGGVITVETSEALLGRDSLPGEDGVVPGTYIALSVTDTGIGMDLATRARIFEPFFTTKEAGKGTGLGLATVYGIVKQSGGHIYVASELGKGTAFKIYLPRVEGREAADARPAADGGSGTETILLVEDEPMVRQLTLQILSGAGYRVLEADGPARALEYCLHHKGPIALMVTDVVMPGLSGRELSRRAATSRPDMKFLFVSGYIDDTITREGVLEPGLPFLEKPFTPDALRAKVRELLSGAAGRGAARRAGPGRARRRAPVRRKGRKRV